MIVTNLIFNLKGNIMTNKMKPQDNATNQANANKGTKGTNRQYSQVHGNRSKQLEQTKANKGA